MTTLREALEELVDLMQGVIDGNYKPDSFTLQPVRAALAAEQQAEQEQADTDLLTYGTSVMKDGKRIDPKTIYLEANQPQPAEQETWANDCRIELVVAVHELASNFENSLYKFKGDDEAMKKAKGDIAHALSVAKKWNWNGRNAPEANQPQAGWKLVPIEPTPEMLFAGHMKIDFDRSEQNTYEMSHESQRGPEGVGTTIEQDMRDCWSAMIAAAPETTHL